jgi:hypothetical protein
MAWIAKAANQPMVLETVDLGPLGAEDVEVAVEHCGLCHSERPTDGRSSAHCARFALGDEATWSGSALSKHCRGAPAPRIEMERRRQAPAVTSKNQPESLRQRVVVVGLCTQ